MGFDKTGDVMLEAISMGATDINNMDEYKFIDMISEFIVEKDVQDFDSDTIISLDKANVLLLKKILDINSTQKLNHAKFELAFAVYQESKDDLDDEFENRMCEFYCGGRLDCDHVIGCDGSYDITDDDIIVIEGYEERTNCGEGKIIEKV